MPLFIRYEVGERPTLPLPALTVADCVLLGLFFLVAVPTKRVGVGRDVGPCARAALLRVVAAGHVVV